MLDKVTYVYIFAKVTPTGLSSPVKIGISKNPHSRRLELQTPFAVGVFTTFEVPFLQDAFDVERLVHKTLNHCRLNGEWFDIPPEQARIPPEQARDVARKCLLDYMVFDVELNADEVQGILESIENA